MQEGSTAAARRVCLFAQFDPDCRLRPRVLRYLGHLASCGFVPHVALSGMARLVPEDRDALDRIGAVPHLRPNVGHDFGAWQHLLRLGCAAGADEVLLANDSVFGPFADLRPIFAAMRRRVVDLWGMVASTEVTWHLQSWFLCLSGRALAHPAVRRVLDQPFAGMTRSEIILHGEIGLSMAVRAAGLSAAAVREPLAGGLRRLAPTNPMHIDWAGMLTGGGVPFVKVELLRDNPMGIPWVARWPDVLGRLPADPVAEIRAELARAGRREPPVRPGWRTRLLYLLLTSDRSLALRSLATR